MCGGKLIEHPTDEEDRQDNEQAKTAQEASCACPFGHPKNHASNVGVHPRPALPAVGCNALLGNTPVRPGDMAYKSP